jgi:glycosyltransferase involved in cell wall biosynthesis
MDVLLTVSQPLAEYYKTLYPDLKKIDVIRSLPKLDENILSQSKQKNEIIQLSFHGYFLPGRGLTELINALADLKDYAFNLNLIGEGPLHNDLAEHIKNLGLNDRITFHPFVASDILLQKIHRADLGIALIEADSINRANALPNKFFEYIHAAVPLLTSNIATLKAYVEKYQVGLTVDPYNKQDIINKLKHIFENPSQLNEYRLHCIKAARELCWQKESKKLKRIYSQLFD